jgi:hypothetical protein
MFGLRSIEQIEAAFGGQLDQVLMRHFVRSAGSSARGSSPEEPQCRR